MQQFKEAPPVPSVQVIAIIDNFVFILHPQCALDIEAVAEVSR